MPSEASAAATQTADPSTTNAPAATESGAQAAEPQTAAQESAAKTPPSETDVEVRIAKERQSAEDRVRTEWAQKFKAISDELDTLKREKMTDDERKQADFDKREQDLRELEAKLKHEQSKSYAMQALAKAGLEDGEYAFLPFVIADDPKETDNRIKALDTAVKARVKAAVEETFKKAGKTPGKGADNAEGAESEGAALGKKIAAQMSRSTENDPWAQYTPK